ncbi:hypothetical protein D918_09204 [Trichuris suis]|nr:hypothetical protein D918_09204 [Trichuris suis]
MTSQKFKLSALQFPQWVILTAIEYREKLRRKVVSLIRAFSDKVGAFEVFRFCFQDCLLTFQPQVVFKNFFPLHSRAKRSSAHFYLSEGAGDTSLRRGGGNFRGSFDVGKYSVGHIRYINAFFLTAAPET